MVEQELISIGINFIECEEHREPIHVLVQASGNIADLKQAVYKQEGVPVGKQIVFSRRNPRMPDDRTLAELDICAHTSVHMKIRSDE